ncbi:MAG: CPBP family intramembrane glutamate endopeptidase, partial [Halorhabdus sp.]
MPNWAAFVALTGIVVSFVILLAYLSQQLLDAELTGERSPVRLQPTGLDPGVAGSRWIRIRPAGRSLTAGRSRESATQSSIPTPALLANVVLTQGFFAGVLLIGALVFSIPLSAFGVGPDPLDIGVSTAGLGVLIGIALWIASEIAVALVESMGFGYDQGLRTMLTPTTTGEWGLLLGVVLPVVAASEEFIFRAAAIGVPATGLDASPWALAVV